MRSKVCLHIETRMYVNEVRKRDRLWLIHHFIAHPYRFSLLFLCLEEPNMMAVLSVYISLCSDLEFRSQPSREKLDDFTELAYCLGSLVFCYCCRGGGDCFVFVMFPFFDDISFVFILIWENKSSVFNSTYYYMYLNLIFIYINVHIYFEHF